MGHKQLAEVHEIIVCTYSTDSDPVAVITGQDLRLIALKIFKLLFFRTLSY